MKGEKGMNKKMKKVNGINASVVCNVNGKEL